MGEHKTNIGYPRRLYLRLDWPMDKPMVVEVSLLREFLERVWKLMLICEKIKRTMHGCATVTIENGPGTYVSIESESVINRLVAMARVEEWQAVRWLWVPDDFLPGCFGRCQALAGMKSQTVIDQDGFWFEATDGTSNKFVSVRLAREWVRQELSR